MIQEQLSLWAHTIGLDEANFKVLFCTVLSFPFSVIFKRLPDSNYTLKNVYIIGVAAFYVFGILNLGRGLFTLLYLSLGCYFITRYLRTALMPWVNFLFLMLHLFYSHIHTQFFAVYDPTVIDITGAQMVLVMKLTSFGWSVHDAKQPADLLTPYARSRAIRKHPNLLPYLGYVFFYASLLTGPAFDYSDYDKFIHSTLFDDVPSDKRPGKGKRRIPKSGRVAAKKVLQGVLWAAVFFKLPEYVSLDYVTLGQFYANHGLVYRIFYFWVLGLAHRLKYYTIWLIAEGACILCGIGYNGYDAETDSFRWNRVQNIDPWAFETGQNVHTCLEAWNMNTNKWLKNYVYLRVAKKGKKPGFKSTLFTFATSAFWHGTNPGYYLTFVMGAFLQTMGRIFRRNLRPIFLHADGKPKANKWVYDIVCYVTTQLAFGFIVQPFVVLELRQSLYVWLTVYFYVPVVTVITLGLFKGPYAKQVTSFFAQYHERPTPKNKLSQQEVALVKKTAEELVKQDAPSLGVPSIEALEEASKEEFDEDMLELKQAWQLFRGRRGSIKDDDFEGLRDAYNNFTTEINDIFDRAKASKRD